MSLLPLLKCPGHFCNLHLTKWSKTGKSLFLHAYLLFLLSAARKRIVCMLKRHAGSEQTTNAKHFSAHMRGRFAKFFGHVAGQTVGRTYVQCSFKRPSCNFPKFLMATCTASYLIFASSITLFLIPFLLFCVLGWQSSMFTAKFLHKRCYRWQMLFLCTPRI